MPAQPCCQEQRQACASRAAPALPSSETARLAPPAGPFAPASTAPLGTAAMPPPPPKCSGMPPLSAPASAATSSQREALTGQPSRLISLEGGGSDNQQQDEYLMRLLRKGLPPVAPAPAANAAPSGSQQQQSAPPAGLQQAANPQEGASGFRAPGPVRRAAPPQPAAPPLAAPASLSPSRRLPRQSSTSLASPSSQAGGATVPTLTASLPAPSSATATTDPAVPSTLRPGSGGSGTGSGGMRAAPASHRAHPPPSAMFTAPVLAAAAAAAPPAAAQPAQPGVGTGFAATRLRLGDELAFTVRNTMIRCVQRRARGVVAGANACGRPLLLSRWLLQVLQSAPPASAPLVPVFAPACS